ncbi:MAG: hypothetical protein R3221_11460, partial [Spongiibacter sp.]|nr:hypothetical protein [Spongiibacter sp.]
AWFTTKTRFKRVFFRPCFNSGKSPVERYLQIAVTALGQQCPDVHQNRLSRSVLNYDDDQ